jgi:hypothetical protein
MVYLKIKDITKFYLECVHKVLDFLKIKIFDDFLFFSLQQMLGNLAKRKRQKG